MTIPEAEQAQHVEHDYHHQPEVDHGRAALSVVQGRQESQPAKIRTIVATRVAVDVESSH
jgi:hypothetical protein